MGHRVYAECDFPGCLRVYDAGLGGEYTTTVLRSVGWLTLQSSHYGDPAPAKERQILFCPEHAREIQRCAS